MRIIGVLTTARSDFGILLPVMRAIEADPELSLEVVVTGMHLSPTFGLTASLIEDEGLRIAHRVEMLLSSDSPEGIAKSIGLGVIGFSQLFATWRPDILVILGDRFEVLAAATASLPFRVPLAHLHGGEATEGLIDEPIRHSLTKMSHLHFASLPTYAERIIQMGEEPWRVVVSGAPSLDNLADLRLLTVSECRARFGVDLSKPTLLVTFHPVTLEYERNEDYIDELIAALEATDLQILLTYPNADTQGRVIIERIEASAARHDRVHVVANLGSQAYYSVMSHAAAMVGNSSSGILESGSFALPVVDIGSRQRGRVRGANVIHSEPDREAIGGAIAQATSAAFRSGLAGMINIYGDGRAAQRIVERLRTVDLDARLLVKRFRSLPDSS